MPRAAQRFWLLKSEPEVLAFDDLWAAPGRRTMWDGVRNYQARNFLRDSLALGDQVLFYHSNAEPTGVAGIAEVASGPYPDPTQFDTRHSGFDPKSTRENPTWFALDIVALRALERVVTLDELKRNPRLAKMVLVQRGSRLSVQPVTREEFGEVLRMAAAEAPRSAANGSSAPAKKHAKRAR
ncbi:MAG: EVE domain-containing protein [Planctomycetes bacterium]|nr:EVE domain-containing protein [Planctomycetota bacterium]